METRYLQTLLAVSAHGSFSKAAEALHLTQSAVSQRIKYLEEQFGQQLLDRSGSKPVLTTAGRLVLAKAREILDKEQEMLCCLRDNSARNRLALGCTPTFGIAFLPRVLDRFMRSHADLHDLTFLFMQPLQAIQALRNAEFDLTVIEHPLDIDTTGLRRYPLPDDEMLFVVAAALRDEFAGETELAELDRLCTLRLFARRDGCSSREVLRQNLQTLGADVTSFSSLTISDDLHLTIQSVLGGTGVAFLSRSLVCRYLDSGEMLGLRVHGFDHRRGRSLLLPASRQPESPLRESFIDCVFQTVSPESRPDHAEGD
ncbi:MAG: LysR family transcriptional regulator [Desulfuromonadales bacterium]|nr:LysR family transcriptional regulator [Desulfuromonadales bacterium]